jgi:hypothetical protein
MVDSHAFADGSPMAQEGRRLTRDFTRGAPGDPSPAMLSKTPTPEQKRLSQRKSQYYDAAFAYRESNNTPRERVYKESVVMAEVRTNVIVCFQWNALQCHVCLQNSGERRIHIHYRPLSQPIHSLPTT